MPRSLPDLREVKEVLQRIAARSGETAAEVRTQHLVSQVVLRRFTLPVGGNSQQLMKLNLKFPTATPQRSAPRGCCTMDYYVEKNSGSAEARWKEVEDDLPIAFATLDSGDLFLDPKHTTLVKDAIALHYARSFQFRALHRQTFEETLERSKTYWRSRPEVLERLFYERTGFHAAGREALEMMVEELLADTVALSVDGSLFRDRVEALFDVTRNLLRPMPLEILTASQGSYAIGDCPVVTFKHGGTAVGPREGVALTQADVICFPAGPRHMASLGGVNGYRAIPGTEVELANHIQVRNAEQWVHFQPGSTLSAFARSGRSPGP